MKHGLKESLLEITRLRINSPINYIYIIVVYIINLKIYIFLNCIRYNYYYYITKLE
jgi:hypothetical protein